MLRMLNQLPAGLDFVLEAPCATWREHLSLRRRTSAPIVDGGVVAPDAPGLGLAVDRDVLGEPIARYD